MARQAVIYTAKGATTHKNVRRDTDGASILNMAEGTARTLVLDFTSLLETSETVDSIAVTQDGVAVATAVASPTVTMTLTAPTEGGYATSLVTLSSGEIIEHKLCIARTTQERDRYA